MIGRGDQEPLPVGVPERFTVDRTGGGLSVRWRWYGHHYLFMVAFCLAWNSFLVGWYQSAWKTDFEEVELMFLLFPIGHVAVGIGLSYYTLAGLFNSTTISVGRGEFRLRHGPVPWIGNRTYSAIDLEQLFCVERQRGQDSHVSYDLRARLRSGTEVKLITGLGDAREARFLEQEIEQAAGIGARPVAGEIPK